MPDFRIHGDNIVECERTLQLIGRALQVENIDTLRPTGSPLTPKFELTTTLSKETYNFTFLPGYGRWEKDILDFIRSRGGCLREAADAILCYLDGGFEVPLIAIEYCGALPAGNQAWQRNGRALSFARSNLPYIYIAELSGYELDSERNLKAARLPNPAVPFSYILLSESTKTPAIPVFVRSPGAAAEAVRLFSPFYGEEQLIEIMRNLLIGISISEPLAILEKKVLSLVHHLADSRQKKDTLPADLWDKAFKKILDGQSLPEMLFQESHIAWSKTAYIEGLTESAKKLMAITAGFACGLTSASLPLCIIEETKREKYVEALKTIYPSIKPEFLQWCCGKGHLAICWVMGFKPRGDDARPDRGLPPLCRMLIGDKTDLLTIVYGPAPISTWPILENDPIGLMEKNGLWESIMICSDGLLIDSSTLISKMPATYTKEHWARATTQSRQDKFIMAPTPTRVGENDVDTVLHLIFSRLGNHDVFEGMCNPPGGDWSGMSLLTEDRKTEVRWLVLPRITAKDAKRPDHIFQIFSFKPSLVIAIESKETARSVERDIGPRLKNYVKQFLGNTPSVHRTELEDWKHFEGAANTINPDVISAAAFSLTSDSELAAVSSKTGVDIIFGLSFSKGRDSCVLHAQACSQFGKAVAEFIKSIDVSGLDLEIRIHQ
jgi:hypothetical protein